MKYVVAIVVGFIAFAANIGAEPGEPLLRIHYPNSPDYHLLIYHAAELDSLEAMYYITRPTEPTPPHYLTYLKLDSIRAVYATATDTNMFIFVCAEGQKYHLIKATISDTVRFDTIMTQGIDPPDNWLAYPETVTILPSFGIVAGNFWSETNFRNYEIRQINRDGTTSLLHEINDVTLMEVSLDRTELYFVIMPSQVRAALYHVLYYHAATDSFQILRDSTKSIMTPARSARNSPFYFVKSFEANDELWRMMPDGSQEIMLQFKLPEIIVYLIPSIDSLQVGINNISSDSTYDLYFVH